MQIRPIFILKMAIIWLPLLSNVLAHGALIDRTSNHVVDRFEQVEKALRDGLYDDAEILLRKSADRLIQQDESRYLALRGRLVVARKSYENAVNLLEQAINKRGASIPSEWILALGEAYHGLEKFGDCRKTYALVENLQNQSIEHQLRFARCLNRSGQAEESWSVLKRIRLESASDRRLVILTQTEILLSQNLFDSALEQCLAGLHNAVLTSVDLVALARSFRDQSRLIEATRILESAKLADPDNEKILLEMARTQVAAGNYVGAARIFEGLSRVQPKYHLEAAELFKRAGRAEDALRHNAQVDDEVEMLRQRFAILLEAQNYEGAVALVSMLESLGLLANEDVRYGVAFAYFRLGESLRAEQHLKLLSRADLFRKAAELRKRMNEHTNGLR